MSALDTIQPTLGPISAHSFNSDRTQLAISPNNHEIHIYKKQNSTWTFDRSLVQHDKLITSLHWGPKTNRIVSCSQDRNAYVWTFDSNKDTWKPTLVLLRINRAATCVKWSPNEVKFAVASGARCISVCYFEQENDWWVSKQIKKPIRSTVLSLHWHPNSVLLAAGAADMTARVFSAWIKGIDEKPAPSPWGDKLPFNTVCNEYNDGNAGWVSDVQFSPNGDAVAWVSQDSTLHVSYPATNTTWRVFTSQLPFTSLLWKNANTIIVAGFDCIPIAFTGDDTSGWKFDKKLESVAKKISSGNSAMDKFRQLDSRAQQSQSSDTELASIHQNTITSIRAHKEVGGVVTECSTAGVDGRVVIWAI